MKVLNYSWKMQPKHFLRTVESTQVPEDAMKSIVQFLHTLCPAVRHTVYDIRPEGRKPTPPPSSRPLSPSLPPHSTSLPTAPPCLPAHRHWKTPFVRLTNCRTPNWLESGVWGVQISRDSPRHRRQQQWGTSSESCNISGKELQSSDENSHSAARMSDKVWIRHHDSDISSELSIEQICEQKWANISAKITREFQASEFIMY